MQEPRDGTGWDKWHTLKAASANRDMLRRKMSGQLHDQMQSQAASIQFNLLGTLTGLVIINHIIACCRSSNIVSFGVCCFAG